MAARNDIRTAAKRSVALIEVVTCKHDEAVQMTLTQRDPTDEGRVPLKVAMRHLAGAVCIVTAGVGAERTGATITTAHSFSVEPEMMAVSINLASSTWTAISHHRHFCVNVLRADQIAVAERFTGRNGLKGSSRYEGARWFSLVTGALALDGVLAAVDCKVEDIVVRHSHALILGRVEQAVIGQPGPALLYHQGTYGSSG
ncbi:flavin reductase family protein [Mesorhizobium sp. CO1-1-8]|uniref:flavin reductase family protein n=1 Tax=Mesorhizobium sp. CO1-1-8 TaxID=2876631 RepID=UPI001CD150A6|nr:flavin reductase family protein [Mesorhizobium sp. CO1-1-8]MBZ9772361.1 flavin reductase family protein [Mesorhizobium sp. CO1-1-8]